jgi:hypothetical protein
LSSAVTSARDQCVEMCQSSQFPDQCIRYCVIDSAAVVQPR